MKPAYEKLLPPPGQSFRCFNRQFLSLTAKWHRHPEIELTYVCQGTGTRIVGDHIASYEDHDLALIGPDLPHTWQSDEFQGNRLDLHPAIVVQFRRDFLGEAFFDSAEFAGVRTMIDRAARGLHFPREFSREMGARLIGMVDLPAGTRLIRLLECLLELSRCEQAVPLASVGFSSSSDFPAASRAERICAYIAEHYCDPELSHQQLALQAEMNPSAFSRFFREATGKTVMNYLAEMRISLACRLLMQTDQPVSEIYRSCGFSHASNFNRQFHRLRRVSAREFRKQHRASVGSLPPAAPDLALQ